MATTKWIKEYVEGIEKDYPDTNLLSGGLWDIEGVNENLESEGEPVLSAVEWNRVVELAYELINWQNLAEEVSDVLRDCVERLRKEQAEDIELWGEEHEDIKNN